MPESGANLLWPDLPHRTRMLGDTFKDGMQIPEEMGTVCYAYIKAGKNIYLSPCSELPKSKQSKTNKQKINQTTKIILGKQPLWISGNRKSKERKSP